MVLNKTLALPVQLGRNSFLIFTNYLDSKQSECAMLEADLASGKWALEHECTAAELANRSLEEARSELKAMREVGKDNDGGYSIPTRRLVIYVPSSMAPRISYSSARATSCFARSHRR